MELKEFISETVKQITDGIVEGNKYIQEVSKNSDGVRNQYTKVDFDVAVTTNDDEKNGVNGKISIANVFSVGGSNESTNKTSNYSRIQFSLLIDVNT